ncbi:MAG: DUF2079 domain-containing protein [Dermabacter sp.]|nr:DUF2079 domain-containing protein [Dermabacter sp.]
MTSLPSPATPSAPEPAPEPAPELSAETSPGRSSRFARLLSPRVAVPLILALAATGLYGALSTLQWNSFFFPSWDLGIFSQAAKAYAALQPPIVTIKGDHFHLLGDHFHPILVLLAPVWWLWPSPLALLWLQAALFGLSAVPLTRVAMARLGPVLGAVAGAGYVFSFGLQGSQNVQFHEYALAVPLLAFGVAAILEKRVRAALVWIGLLVFVKEDLGLTVAMLGLALAWMQRDPARPASRLRRLDFRGLEKRGLWLAAWGVAWWVLATFVILPALNPAGSYDYTDNFASLAQLIGPWDKWVTLAMLVAFMGGIGVMSPLAWALLPTLAWRFLGNVEAYWTWQWHYNSILMPIAFGALLHLLPTVRERWKRWAAVGLSLASTAYLGTALPLTWLAGPAFDPDSPGALAAAQAVAAVPEGATVAADVVLLAPLVPKADVQWLHGDARRAPECVVGRLGDRERQWAPHGYAAWANAQWPVSTPPQILTINGGSVQISADAPYESVLNNGYFEVVCQAGSAGAPTR